MKDLALFDELVRIHQRPEPFGYSTARELWTDEHVSARMLSYHLDTTSDVSSRNGAFIERSVDWIARRFEIGRSTAIADFGCGPGLYANALARRGARVTGIDFSERSIDYAKTVAARERLDVRYVTQDYLDFETDERFDLVLMIMCDFCALGPAQRGRLLAKFRDILTPGGVVLLDVYSLLEFDRVKESTRVAANMFDGFWSPNDYFCFKSTFKYGEEKVVLEKYTIVESDRVRTVYNWFQYFSVEALEREFRTNGFARFEWLTDVAGRPYDPGSPEFAVIAQI